LTLDQADVEGHLGDLQAALPLVCVQPPIFDLAARQACGRFYTTGYSQLRLVALTFLTLGQSKRAYLLHDAAVWPGHVGLSVAIEIVQWPPDYAGTIDGLAQIVMKRGLIRFRFGRLASFRPASTDPQATFTQEFQLLLHQVSASHALLQTKLIQNLLAMGDR
jgi:hypothetical protein